MSTAEDLRHDAIREEMLDRCEALHVDWSDPDCPGCDEREQMKFEDQVCEKHYEADHPGIWVECTPCMREIGVRTR